MGEVPLYAEASSPTLVKVGYVCPGVELRANLKSNLPQMPPLRVGICTGVD